MLRHREGASGPQIAEAMGWASHTVRGFLAGLAKKGIRVDVLITCARRVALKPQGQGPLHHRCVPSEPRRVLRRTEVVISDRAGTNGGGAIPAIRYTVQPPANGMIWP
jgi:hypothetical protein